MNSLLLISPSKGSGFKPILSGNVQSETTGFVLSQQIGTLRFSRRVRCDRPFEVYLHFGGTLQLKKKSQVQ